MESVNFTYNGGDVREMEERYAVILQQLGHGTYMTRDMRAVASRDHSAYCLWVSCLRESKVESEGGKPQYRYVRSYAVGIPYGASPQDVESIDRSGRQIYNRSNGKFSGKFDCEFVEVSSLESRLGDDFKVHGEVSGSSYALLFIDDDLTDQSGAIPQYRFKIKRQDEIESLREEYKSKFGKKAYHGWSAEELKEKIAGAE